MFGCLHVSKSNLRHLTSDLRQQISSLWEEKNRMKGKITVSYVENWMYGDRQLCDKNHESDIGCGKLQACVNNLSGYYTLLKHCPKNLQIK